MPRSPTSPGSTSPGVWLIPLVVLLGAAVWIIVRALSARRRPAPPVVRPDPGSAGRPAPPARSDGVHLDGVQPDGARRDGIQLDGIQLDGIRLDGPRSGGVLLDGALSDSAAPEPAPGAAAGTHALLSPSGVVSAAAQVRRPPRPRPPGAVAPLPDGSAPGPEYTIKGNAASMLFHSPGSPYYARTKAAFWFRSADEARAAGFTEWTPRRRS